MSTDGKELFEQAMSIRETNDMERINRCIKDLAEAVMVTAQYPKHNLVPLGLEDEYIVEMAQGLTKGIDLVLNLWEYRKEKDEPTAEGEGEQSESSEPGPN